MIINSFLEILSIGALIPLIALFFEGNNSSIFSNIPVLQNIFSNLTFFLDIKSILIIIFLIFFVKNFFIIFYHFCLGKIMMHIRLRFVKDLYKKYLSQNYEFFLSKNSSEIIRNINEAQYFTVVLSSYLTFFLEILVIIFLAFFLILVNFQVTMTVIICLSLAIFLINKFSKNRLLLWGTQRQKYQKDINKNIFENFLNIKEIKILNKENFFSKKLIYFDKYLASIDFKTDIFLQLPRMIIEILYVFVINYSSRFEHLKLSNVSFNYKNNKILSNINMAINKNSISCFVGKNGSGKTTLINIISGLLKPTKGKVLFNGNTNLNKNSLKIGYVAQNINLIDDTVKNNILFGNSLEKFNNKNFLNSIKYSGINDFIKKLPNKFNTFVGDRGTKISGGQSQRIGIARALYNNPDILILDEFNSNLDTFSEQKIIKNFNILKKTKTIIIITHKKSLIKFCDNAFLIKNKKLKRIK